MYQFITRVILAVLYFASIASGAETARILEVSDADRGTFIACLELRIAAAEANSARLLILNESGFTIAPLPIEPAVSMNDKDYLLRRASVDGATEKVFHVYARTNCSASAFAFKVGDRRYPLIPKDPKFGALPAQAPSSFGPLKDFEASSVAWSEAVKLQVLRSTVSITGPASKGTGTMVETPAELASLLKPGEVLVVTAAHVTPSYLKSDTIEVTVFEYDQALTPTVKGRYKGRIVVSGSANEHDVALLAFTPVEYVVVKAKLANRKRWFAQRSQYLCVGCPGGELPRFSFEKAIQASLQQSVVWIEKTSERGESGGGMFDQDGALLAVCARTYEKPSAFNIGSGLLGADEEALEQKTLRPSIFTHAPSTLTAEVLKQRVTAQARSDFESALHVLPEADQIRLRAEFEKALQNRR